MAKRRKNKKTGRRRRRMGSLSNGTSPFLMQAAGVAVAHMVGTKIDKVITDYIAKSKDPTKMQDYAIYISAGGKMAGGFFLNKKANHPFLKGLAIGLAGEGAGQLGGKVFKLNGLARPGVLGRPDRDRVVTISGLLGEAEDASLGDENDSMGANPKFKRPDVLGMI